MADVNVSSTLKLRDLWSELHKHQLSTSSRKWYEEWLARIPQDGCECRSHWIKMNKIYPILKYIPTAEEWENYNTLTKYMKQQQYFKYTVFLHNEVNKRLGKPYLPVHEAEVIYFPMESSCVHRSKPIGEVVGCCGGPLTVYKCNLLNKDCMLQAKKGAKVEYHDGTSSEGYNGEQCLGCNKYCPRVEDITDDWRYVTTVDLIHATQKLASKIEMPSCIIAVPTSGLIVASYLSTLLHVPLYTTLNDFLNDNPLVESKRSHSRKHGQGSPLVIDDTCHGGNAMQALTPFLPPGSKKAAVYCLPSAKHYVDYYGELLPAPHLLEWNLFNSGIIDGKYHYSRLTNGTAIDFDGVLCHDPSVHYVEGKAESDKVYEDWLVNASPRHLIRNRKIPVIVTWRCEMYRKQTEEWLYKHGVRYDKLVMWDGPPESRHWKPTYKGDVYKDSGCDLFIESNALQAYHIYKYTGKPVLCLASTRLYKN